MFDDYRRAVLLDYIKKKDEHEFPANLRHPTPAGLRDACLWFYENSIEKRDDKILRLNFKVAAGNEDYRSVIEKYDTDKFKPLINWLIKESNIRDNDKVELLACLIHFEPRPYRRECDYAIKDDTEQAQIPVNERTGDNSIEATDETNGEAAEQNLSVANREAVEGHGETTSEAGKDAVKQRMNEFGEQTEKHGQAITAKTTFRFPPAMKTISLTLVLALIVAIGIYWINRPPVIDPDKQCMFWDADHYEPARCDKKTEGLIALDTEKVAHFRKVDRSKLTAASLGKVWYIKIDGHIEFYTHSGYHPNHPERKLSDLTNYILDKYAYSDNSGNGIAAPLNQANTVVNTVRPHRYVEVFLNINSNDRVLINGRAATAEEISGKPNTLKLITGQHYKIRINNCPEQEIIPTENTTLSACM